MPIFSVLFLIGFLNALQHNSTNLAIYYSECGFTKELIGLFCLLSFPFSAKILWAPIIDHVRLPFLTKSPRKAWFLVALMGIAFSFFLMATIDAASYTGLFALALFMLSIFAGCLYMVGIAYELESIPTASYSVGSSCLITGYRTGLLFAGAGVLYIAYIASWSSAFLICALLTVLSAIIMLMVQEPYRSYETLEARRNQLKSYPTVFQGIVQETFIQPCRRFLESGQWVQILSVIVLFKMADHMAKPMEGPFYLDLGFDKKDLALAAKTFGFASTIVGAFLAGKFLKGKNPYYAVAILSMIHALSESGCLIHSLIGKSYTLLYVTSGLSNLTGGMLITAFISLLWKSCDTAYAPVQYAFLWSLSAFATNLMACSGGFLAERLSWPGFFCTMLCIGVASSLTLLYIVAKARHNKILYLKQAT
ncbi:MAG: MFS transporter [Verrucomicrobia bacterium]|nr:MFS transporter [Verrucomicrobiota bacterium]MBS0636447.1 MFS transporter [Verrucomicrobiota bacterium]